MISEQSQQPDTPTSENGRIRPTRPAPAIPTGLSRSATRRSAPAPPARSATSTDSQPQAAPRKSAPSLRRQGSVEDNTAYTVRPLRLPVNVCVKLMLTNNPRADDNDGDGTSVVCVLFLFLSMACFTNNFVYCSMTRLPRLSLNSISTRFRPTTLITPRAHRHHPTTVR